MPEAKVIVIVAPSGAGKTTMARRLVSEFGRIHFSVSATTRPPRTHEVDGVDYHFLSPVKFQNLVDQNEFLEWEEVFNQYRYGTLKSAVEKQLHEGYFPLLDIEVNGALNVKHQFADRCISFFIQPPSMEVLRQRLMHRGTESGDSITYRMERARKELQLAPEFDYVITNDEFERAYNEIKSILLPFLADY